MAATGTQNKPATILGVKITNKGDQAGLMKQRSLRRLVGILGILLPVLLYLFLLFGYGHQQVLPSISHYFYTRASICFIIVVSTLAIFLLTYKDDDPIDFYLSSAAGVFALCVLLFPTDNLVEKCGNENFPYIITYLPDIPARKIFHFISAAIFLGCLDAMSFFLFTKSNEPKSKRGWKKIWRNRIYRVCSLFMTLALLVAFLGFLKVIPPAFYDEHNLTFWMEAVAIEAFGISWLVKGETILTD